MNNLIFWIIVCSWVIPVGIRMYNRSKARRIHNDGFPGYPPQNLPGPGYPPQNYPGYPTGPADIGPADATPPEIPPSGASPQVPPPASGGSAPQGYRARKLAELDAKFSNGEIAMEDYMKQRGEIMNG
ncbi:hypothetical protein [Paenarthrobacter ureafaciens]|uniref:hypothetical protein n=1 Tax=Paenarthrobacter ureafaciens TaxID=37931 RepID=UPI0009AC0FAD|nr:hypothetical protein [Paenarthrobacter ureafaciens]GLU57975.1 hypothetical protein Pure01_04880 [Paenarthrobacter ureafaciens]GLU62648.1 hypothetical protein Pure02_08980 [Paenarthrobacter ureafaciens]GLU66864.1 hypothetical protein Pure03_08400 [Paenarthrobacter ureafaciens]GLU70834.1 hypothetical protein Pure04_05490 [Paenarthrobacter ureafaciens]GLU75455.1 hypothetical protein Pure05_08950 [Paenarthrobacter ureafaciens]